MRTIIGCFKRGMAFGFLLVSMSVGIHADTVTLVDGTKLEGTILAEDANSVTIEVMYSGGTIRQKNVIEKARIKEVVRLTEEQKLQQAVETAYATVAKYQLHPSSSFTLDQYNQVITAVLEPFLAKYPDAPQATKVREQLAAWATERDLVAGGKVKVKGEWLDKTQTALQQADMAVLKGDFSSAIKVLHAAEKSVTGTAYASTVRGKLIQVYGSWVPMLELQKAQMETRIKSTEQDIQRYQAQKQQAEAAMGMKSVTPSQPAETGTNPYAHRKQVVAERLGQATANHQAQTNPSQPAPPVQKMGSSGGAELAQAVQQLAVLEPSLTKLRNDHQVVVATLDRARQWASATVPSTMVASADTGAPANIAETQAAAGEVTTTTTESQAEADSKPTNQAGTTAVVATSQDKAKQAMAFAKQNWLLVASGALVLLGLIVMAIPRRS
jgi:hypothetical protein